MRSDIAQMITLTSYGNAYLDNQSFTIDLHSTTNPCKQSTTDTCKKIDFIEINV